MGLKSMWQKVKSFNLDFLYDFDWEEIKKRPG